MFPFFDEISIRKLDRGTRGRRRRVGSPQAEHEFHNTSMFIIAFLWQKYYNTQNQKYQKSILFSILLHVFGCLVSFLGGKARTRGGVPPPTREHRLRRGRRPAAYGIVARDIIKTRRYQIFLVIADRRGRRSLQGLSFSVGAGARPLTAS